VFNHPAGLLVTPLHATLVAVAALPEILPVIVFATVYPTRVLVLAGSILYAVLLLS
jgi:hypothetical protein